MNKKTYTNNEIASILAKELSITQKDTRNILNKYWETMERLLSEESSIRIKNVGTIELRKRASKKVYLSQKDKFVTVSSHTAPFFSFSKVFVEKFK